MIALGRLAITSFLVCCVQLSWAQVSTTTTLASSPNPSFVNQNTMLTATVSGANPTGNVLFYDAGNQIGNGTLSGNSTAISFTFNSTGTHALTAVYQGDANFRTSTSAVRNQTVNAQTASSTVLSSNVPSPSLGQSVVLTATITGSSPTGTVTFYDSNQAVTLGTATVGSSKAALSVSFSAVGSHNLSASYSGDAPNTSSSASLALTVIPGNMTWAFGYDPQGNLTQSTNPFGWNTTNSYDSLQRKTSIVQPAVAASPTPTTITSYDGQDNIKSVQDPRNLTTNYTLDGLANKTAQSSPDTATTNATFDAVGNLLTRTDARNIKTTFTYDVLNRVKTIGYPTGTGTTFEYDGGSSPYPGSRGQLTKLTDESGVTTFTYDALSRPVGRSTLAGGKTMSIAYAWGTTGTATGKLTAITYPSGARVNYQYDTAGRVKALTVNPPNSNGVGTNTGSFLNILSGITYNADNNILGWTWADNATYARTYDSFGRLSTFPVGYPLGTGISGGLTRTLAYDNAARITGYTHTNSSGAQASFNQTFGYDGLDRLLQQGTSSLNYGYTYDATGNRTSQKIGANTYTNTVSSTSNRLTVVQTAGTGGAAVNNTQNYTASGSLTGDGTATYVYSARGRMSSSTASGSTTSYLYNGLEQRVSKTGTLVPTGAAYYEYDLAGHTIGEYASSLAPVAETVYIDDVPVAVLKETGTAAASTIALSVGNVYADQINTPRIVTRNSDEAILWRWDSTEAFGNSAPNENPSALGAYKYNQRMPGQVFDAEDQDFYNLNRDYQPRTGRYAQSDPIGLRGGINTYSYVAGNPLSYVDPLGLAADVLPTPIRIPNVTPSPWLIPLIPLLIPGDTAGDDGCNKCAPATPANIRAILNQGGPWLTLQPSISASHVQSLVNAIEAGATLPPVQADGYIIVDGNHRFVAAFLCRKGLSIQPWTAPLSTPRIPIGNLQILP